MNIFMIRGTMSVIDIDRMATDLRLLAVTIAERAPKEASIHVRLPRWFFVRDGGAIKSWQQDVDTIQWKHTNAHMWLASLEPYSSLESILETIPTINEWIKLRVHGSDPVAVRKSGINSIIRDFVLSVFERGQWTISEGNWAACIERLQQFAKGRVTHRLLAFLHGLSVAGKIELEGLTLREPTHAELLELYNRDSFEGPFIGATSCAAVIEGSECTSFGSKSLLSARAAGLITALRIWTRSPVLSMATYEAEDRDPFLGSMRPSVRQFHWGLPDSVLEDPVGFASFYHRVREILLRPPKALGVALRRIDLMVDQERSSDRMLDLYIILEALFQLGDEKQELAYRLSLRTAHFSGIDHGSRIEINKIIKAGYGLRSKIAHGSLVSDTDQELVGKVEDVVFAAMRRYCERAGTLSNDDAHRIIIDEIDSYLLERKGDD